MTRLEPSLFVQQLVVLRDTRVVAHIPFHLGVNVIAGENSAGKTTLVRFLAYGLGAENINFNVTALLCTAVMVEASLNGAVMTLRRDISRTGLAPLSVYWGPLKDASQAAAGQWQTFPFRRSQSLTSFSQVLFQGLHMPELRGESGSNITMHQILRLMYSDQETPGADLFRFERFDTAITRQAVGDYVLGVDDTAIYDLQLRIGVLEKEEAGLVSGLRAVFNTLGRAGAGFSLEFIEPRVQELGGQLAALETKLAYLRSEAPIRKGRASSEDEQIRNELNATHKKISALKDRRLDIEKQLADTALFVSELNERVKSSSESRTAAAYLGDVRFSVCPCCFTPITLGDGAAGQCALCKSVFSHGGAATQLARMQAELLLQVRESEEIARQLRTEIASLDGEIGISSGKLTELEQRFKASKSSWRTSVDVDMEDTLTKIGSVQQELKQLLELRKLGKELATQQERRAEIAGEVALLREKVSAMRSMQTNRRLDASETVTRHLGAILRNDLPRQAEFSSPVNINFDFGANKLTVDSTEQFSASSTVYLRHSFRLALLFASLEKSYFRHLRLVIIDGIEDGGMEPERSYNFQEVILRMSNEQLVDHQVIIATSHIAATLDRPEYVVGRKLTHDNRALAVFA